MNSTTISTPSHTASEAWRARPTSHSLAEAARENVLGGAVVSCLKSCQHSARRREVAGGAASAAATRRRGAASAAATRWRVARRGVVRGASVASCVLAVLECKELWGNELWLYCYVVLYSILVCTVYYTAEKAKFYTVCTYVSNSWELTIFMHVFTSMNEICQLDIIMVYLDATSRHLKPVTNYNLAESKYSFYV